jgi:hypothetical protein
MNEWYTGLNNFKKHTVTEKNFYTLIREFDFEPDRNINDIFYDHLSNRSTKKVEILFSGGADSEYVLKSCIYNSIPLEVMTMIIQYKGITLNVTDLYYSEKFCRENDIKQNLFYLDVDELFSSGKYLEYLIPYSITEPHVASHFWLIEQCNNYPIFGGDWTWYQQHKKVLSPIRLDYTNYERFMENKGISGIGNMIGHSFESLYRFIELQKQNDGVIVPLLKQKMYDMPYPRIRSYGWESVPRNIFDISKFKTELINKIGIKNPIIIWGDKIKTLINSDKKINSTF